jgi:hypothetical protein
VIPRAQLLPKQFANIFRQNDIRSLAGLAFRDGCALTLILALAVTVVLVLSARDQQESVPTYTVILTTGLVSDSCNLPTVVDRDRYSLMKTKLNTEEAR